MGRLIKVRLGFNGRTAPYGIFLNHETIFPWLPGPYERVSFGVQTRKFLIIDPRMLNKLELTAQIGIETNEKQTPLLLRLQGFLHEFGRVHVWAVWLTIGTSPAKNPVPLGYFDRFYRVFS
jgi:hypothetical protein